MSSRCRHRTSNNGLYGGCMPEKKRVEKNNRCLRESFKAEIAV